MSDDYVPIDCGFHDRLEDAAVRRREVSLEVVEDGDTRIISARIVDLFSRSGADWARIVEVGGEERVLRLDRIRRLGGLLRPGADE